MIFVTRAISRSVTSAVTCTVCSARSDEANFKRRAERKIRRGDARGGETMDDGERVEQSHGFGRCVGSVGVRRGACEAW